jgi:hypothetical protein
MCLLNTRRQGTNCLHTLSLPGGNKAVFTRTAQTQPPGSPLRHVLYPQTAGSIPWCYFCRILRKHIPNILPSFFHVIPNSYCHKTEGYVDICLNTGTQWPLANLTVLSWNCSVYVVLRILTGYQQSPAAHTMVSSYQCSTSLQIQPCINSYVSRGVRGSPSHPPPPPSAYNKRLERH